MIRTRLQCIEAKGVLNKIVNFASITDEMSVNRENDYKLCNL